MQDGAREEIKSTKKIQLNLPEINEKGKKTPRQSQKPKTNKNSLDTGTNKSKKPMEKMKTSTFQTTDINQNGDQLTSSLTWDQISKDLREER